MAPVSLPICSPTRILNRQHSIEPSHGEPLLVVKEGDSGKFRVVEGNRRLSTVKLLVDPTLARIRKRAVAQASASARNRPDALPVVQFEERSEILDYLGYRHITGIKEWDALQKARYLAQLVDTLDPELETLEKHRALARQIGSRSDYVARLLTGYAIYEVIEDQAFFGIRELDEEGIQFSVLTTALSYKNIAEYIGLETGADVELDELRISRLRDLVAWLFEKEQGVARIGESRNLRLLNLVVANEQALNAFQRGSPLEKAVDLTGEPNEVFRTAILAARQSLNNANSKVHLVEGVVENDATVLHEIVLLARQLENTVNRKLMGDFDNLV